MQDSRSFAADQNVASNDLVLTKDRETTIASLDEFIRTQRALLERQRSDIERLQVIKREINSLRKKGFNQAKPSSLEDNTLVLDETPSSHKLVAAVDAILSVDENKSALHISEQVDLKFGLPAGFKWTCFEMCDTTRLRTLHQSAQLKTADRLNPRTKSSLPPSDLQSFVRQARSTMVEPILAEVEATILDLNKFYNDSDYETDEEERTRQREREKIRELMKKRRLGGGLSLPSSRIVTLEGSDGDKKLEADGDKDVHIRRDVEDETIEVDIADARSTSMESSIPHLGDKALPAPYIGGKRWPLLEPGCVVKAPPPDIDKPTKVKRKTNTKKSKTKRRSEDSDSEMEVYTYDNEQLYGDDFMDEDVTDNKKGRTTTKGKAKTSKPKPETYKQAWTDSEQNLLEQLLDQIPEGENFRWQKISRAMGGRRTPRQVASRVQKYFEKLKRFGVVLGQGTADT